MKRISFTIVPIEVFAIIGLTIMLIEMCIYLAYFKDIIFSLVTLMNYVGLLLYQTQHKMFNQSIVTCLITMISMTGVFILFTLIHDYDKAFYLKYKRFYKRYKAHKKRAKTLSTENNKKVD